MPTPFASILLALVTLASASARLAAQDSLHFAVIGDFGWASQREADVAKLVKSWNPDFIITLGDNNYPKGEASTIDANIGAYYADYIGNYRGAYGRGSDSNRFWPCIGNHDGMTKKGEPYLNYFTLPGNERYYDFTRGPVHFFVLNSDRGEPDGITADSRQAAWLKERMAAASEPWKIVYMHHAPYSSGDHGPSTFMQWPFKEWGADLVMSGHDHTYERLQVDGLTYIVNGLGGAVRYKFTHAQSTSATKFNSDNGAMLVDATRAMIRMQFIARDGTVVDDYLMQKP